MRAPRTILRESEATSYPTYALQRLADPTLGQVALWGNPTLWTERQGPLLALFCSTKAPASIILQVHDLAQGWRTGGVTVISGFHSPVEQECLAVLLRGPGAVIVCPARGLDRMRLKPEYKEPMAAGRLLLISPFGEKVRRMTADTALTRNRFVAALADAVLIAHAQPGSKTELLAQEAVEWGKQVHTLDHPSNEHLPALGVLTTRPASSSLHRATLSSATKRPNGRCSSEYTFPQAGTYTAACSVQDDQGGERTVVQVIEVK